MKPTHLIHRILYSISTLILEKKKVIFAFEQLSISRFNVLSQNFHSLQFSTDVEKNCEMHTSPDCLVCKVFLVSHCLVEMFDMKPSCGPYSLFHFNVDSWEKNHISIRTSVWLFNTQNSKHFVRSTSNVLQLVERKEAENRKSIQTVLCVWCVLFFFQRKKSEYETHFWRQRICVSENGFFFAPDLISFFWYPLEQASTVKRFWCGQLQILLLEGGLFNYTQYSCNCCVLRTQSQPIFRQYLRDVMWSKQNISVPKLFNVTSEFKDSCNQEHQCRFF